MKILRLIFIVASAPLLLHGQHAEKRFEKIIRNVSNHIERNYQTDHLQNIEHFEVTYNSQKDLIEAVHINGVQIAPIRMWDLKQTNLQSKSKNTEGQFGYPYFDAELYSINNNGTLATKYQYANVPFYASDVPYFPISRIFLRDFLLPSLSNNDREIGAKQMFISIGKPTLSSEKTDRQWDVTDTLYNGENCIKLLHAECINYFFTEQDSLNLLSQPYPLSWDERNRKKEIITFWNGGKICVQETFIVRKKDYAVLFFQSSKEAIDNTGQEFSEYFFTEFEKQGQKYVPKKFFFNGHNYIENTPFFSQLRNQTLIVRTPSPTSKSLTEAKFIPRGGVDLYLQFCNMLEKPSPTMLEFWETHKNIIK